MDIQLRIGQPGGDGRGFITARIIHEDHQIHDPLLHDLVIGLLKGLCRIVGRHDDDDFFILEHRSSDIPVALLDQVFYRSLLLSSVSANRSGLSFVGPRSKLCLVIFIPGHRPATSLFSSKLLVGSFSSSDHRDGLQARFEAHLSLWQSLPFP